MHSCWGMSLMEQVIRLTILQQRHQVFKSYKSGDGISVVETTAARPWSIEDGCRSDCQSHDLRYEFLHQAASEIGLPLSP